MVGGVGESAGGVVDGGQGSAGKLVVWAGRGVGDAEGEDEGIGDVGAGEEDDQEDQEDQVEDFVKEGQEVEGAPRGGGAKSGMRESASERMSEDAGLGYWSL
jgi:hypothetical protein